MPPNNPNAVGQAMGVVGIGHIDIARSVGRDTKGEREARRAARAVGAAKAASAVQSGEGVGFIDGLCLQPV